MDNTENNEKKSGGLTLLVDNENVTISIDRYTELVKKEEQLDLVSRLYFTKELYAMSDTLSLLFGPKPVKKEE